MGCRPSMRPFVMQVHQLREQVRPVKEMRRSSMRSIVMLTAMALCVICGAAGPAGAESRAELVSTTLVWDGANHATNPDLIRFGDQWVIACQESKQLGYPGGIVRLLISDDGEQWESAALLECPSRKRGLY